MKKYLILIALEIAMFAVEAAFYNKVLAVGLLILGVLTIIRSYKNDNPPSKANLIAACVLQVVVFYFVWLRYIKC